MKKIINIIIFLFTIVSNDATTQSPFGIPFQAVLRNTDGNILQNSSVNMVFTIHEGTSDGSISYQESHALISSEQGSINCEIGGGLVILGNFNDVDWSQGAKFLQVEMNGVDLGTQQMLSVPYALYANKTGELSVNVSVSGDTLFLGNENFVVIPGISISNSSASNTGSVLLPGNDTCDDQEISRKGCQGQTSMVYNEHTYGLIDIYGQCWFTENLTTDKYNNGEIILSDLDSTTWTTTTEGAYAIYENENIYNQVYGKLYNWYAAMDERGLCPLGWRVPSDCDWMYLESRLGMSWWLIEQLGDRGTNQGEKLKSTTNWTNPNLGASNSSGFTALPGGFLTSSFEYLEMFNEGVFLSTTEDVYFNAVITRNLRYDKSNVIRNGTFKNDGVSVRCVRFE